MEEDRDTAPHGAGEWTDEARSRASSAVRDALTGTGAILLAAAGMWVRWFVPQMLSPMGKAPSFFEFTLTDLVVLPPAALLLGWGTARVASKEVGRPRATRRWKWFLAGVVVTWSGLVMNSPHATAGLVILTLGFALVLTELAGGLRERLGRGRS